MLFNAPRAQTCMRRYGLDALIASSPVNIAYFTDYTCWIDPLMKEYMMAPGAPSHLFQGYALFPRESHPVFIVSGSLMAVNAIDLWVEDVRVFGKPGLDTSIPPSDMSMDEQRIYDILMAAPRYPSAQEALVGVLKERGLDQGRIGLECEGLPESRRKAVMEALPDADIRDASNMIRLIRMVKSADEIERLTRAAEISEQAGMEALSLARPGASLQQCVRHFRERLAGLNADMDHFAFGYRGLGIATAPDHILREDTVEYVDWGCVYRCCFSDTGSTLAMRPLSGQWQRRFDALRASMDAGIAAIRPGARSSQVQSAMWEAVTAHGLSNLFPHGHGVGLEVRDYPVLVPDNGLHIRDGWVDEPSDLPVETDMVLNVEAPLFMPGAGSIHLEQSVVVTDGGCRPLTAQERRRPVIPGG
jgi:Xaa-Pro aminopeptidase